MRQGRCILRQLVDWASSSLGACVYVCVRKCAGPWGVHCPHENRDSGLLPCIFYALHHFMCITNLMTCVSKSCVNSWSSLSDYSGNQLFWDQIIPCRVEPCTIVPILRRKRKFVAVLLTHYTNSTGNYENLFLSWFVESINTMFLQNFPACVW